MWKNDESGGNPDKKKFLEDKKVMENKTKIGAIAVVVFAIGIICSILMIPLSEQQIQSEIITKTIPEERKQWVVLEAQIVDDPTTGTNSGICGFYVFETGSTYTSNLTSGTSGYVAGGSAINATNLDIKHTVGQDLIVWARFNDTDSGLDVDFTRCNLTWTGNITGTTAPDHTIVTYSGANFIYVNYVWDNSNAGYTINRNQKDIPIDDIILSGYK